MAKLEIQIHTRKMLKPSTPTPDHLRTFNLSLFDQLAPHSYVPVLFHYLPNNTTEGTIIITERCDKIQKSLAQTLTKFYPLAGRFVEDECSIHCNDEGVEYIETKVVNSDLAEFLRQGTKNTELLNDLIPIDMQSCPLLGIQVNLFNCGGLVMGIQMSHILADAFTLATFVKEWTRICQTGTTKDCLPSFGHLTSLFPSTSRVVSGAYMSPPSHNRDTKIVTRRFMFDALAIAKLKERIMNYSSSAPTRVVVVMSLLWKVLTGISTAKHGHSRDSHLIFPVNLRGKSILPYVEHALGNFWLADIATLEASHQSRKELSEYVNMVGSRTRDISATIAKASVNDIITSMFATYGTQVINKLGLRDEIDIYPITSWCGFPWYEADFGWGKPFWVSSISFDAFEGIFLMETKNGDGVEAWVSLKENDMTQFERDADILTFRSPQLP